MGKLGDVEIDVTVNGLDKLKAFLDEHGEKLRLFSVLDIQKGDIIVLTTKEVLNKTAFENIRKSIKSILGEDIKGVILEEGLEIAGVLRKDRGPDLRSMADIQEGDDG